MITNLAVQLTTFVGRDRELVELRQRLQDVRLLTLVGAVASARRALRSSWSTAWRRKRRPTACG